MRLEPVRRPLIERGDLLAFALGEVVAQQILQQMVVAVPLAVVVERDEKQVRLVHRLQERPGILGLERCVAQRSAHRTEHRRAPQERQRVRCQIRQRFGAQVLRDISILARDAHRAVGAVSALHGQPGERQAGRPALGASHELDDVRVCELHAGRPQQDLRLAATQGEHLRADLEEPAARAQPRNPQRRCGTPGHDEQRALRDLVRERRNRVHRLLRPEQVSPVEHHHEAALHRGDRRRQARHSRPPDGRLRGNKRIQRGTVDRLDPGERDRQVPEQNDRVVIARIDRHPRERPLIAHCPLREERCLPVARRRSEHHDRRRRHRPQAVDQPDSGDRVRPQPGRPHLRCHEVERRRARRLPSASLFLLTIRHVAPLQTGLDRATLMAG